MPTINVKPIQKSKFEAVIWFVQQEKAFENKRVTQSDAFELLIQLFQASVDRGMMPNE